MRIGAQLSGFERRLLTQLDRANAAATTNTFRLATGQKVNSPGDDPAAFVQISSLQSRLSVVQSTASQVEAASTAAAEAELALTQIRTQLDAIRTALLTDTDAGAPLTAEQRAEQQATIDSAIEAIETLVGGEYGGRRLLDGSTDFWLSGRDSSQVRQVDVFRTGAGLNLPGTAAELTYTGNNEQLAADAHITITGDLGQAGFQLTEGTDLTSVASTINLEISTTGVLAQVDGNRLTLRSVATGSDADVSVTVDTGAFELTGGDGNGTASGADAVTTATPAIAGSVTQAAQQASLSYTGAGGLATADATFTLTGTRGSASIDVTNGQSLTDLRDAINDESYATGVVAEVSGDRVTLSTVDYGTRETIAVAVTSGTFDVAGGNGDGTAQGTDAEAVINGRTYTGGVAVERARLIHTEATGQLTADVAFRVTGNDGSYDFSFNASDSLSTVAAAIEAQSGTTGVGAYVSADGTQLILASDDLGDDAQTQVQVTDGDFALTTDVATRVVNYTSAQQAELYYTSASGLITADAQFDLTGETGTVSISVTQDETLATVAQRINDQTGSTGVRARVASVDGADDTLVIYSDQADANASAEVSVTSGTFNVTGGHGDGTANGVDAVTLVTGGDTSTSTQVDGNRFTVADQSYQFTVEFVADFTGDFSTMTVSDTTVAKFALSTDLNRRTTLSMPSLLPARMGGLSGNLAMLATGGGLDGLDDNTAQAIRVVDEALGQIDIAQGRLAGFADAAVGSSANLLSSLETTLEESLDTVNGIDESEETLLLAKNQALASNVLASLTVMQQQRQMMVDLVKQIAGLDS